MAAGAAGERPFKKSVSDVRVIGGHLGGRRLFAPPGIGVRPTPDRVREALFDILGERVRGRVFLDLFAGSGAVGIEALSRGASTVILVESNPLALRYQRRNLETMGIAEEVQSVAVPWPRALSIPIVRKCSFGFVFADPPYKASLYARILQSLEDAAVLDPEGWVIVEHEARNQLPDQVGDLSRVRLAVYGSVGLAFYRRRGASCFPAAEKLDSSPQA